MKKILFSLLFIIIIFLSIKETKFENSFIEIEEGGISLISEKGVSKDFAYCSAVIAHFDERAIFAHAFLETLGEDAFPLIWENKIYNEGRVFSANVIQRILNITDSL